MSTKLRNLLPVAALLFACVALLAACGDSDDESSDTTTESEATSDPAAVDPAAVESSVEEFLATDEYAADLSATVDCPDEPAETLECEITGDKGLTGMLAASPSPGFQYTGDVEGPDGPSSLGGSSPQGSVTEPATVEEGLNQLLSDEAGKPTAACPDAAEGDSLECEVTGDGVTGTLTVTPIGGFEWVGHLDTPDGPRSISGNALP